MAMHEKTGQRELHYSAWHRPSSISRFTSHFDSDKHRVRFIDSQSYVEYSDPYKRTTAAKLGMIDIDHFFIDGKHWADRGPVALIEAARTEIDPNQYQYQKPATILAHVGRLANLPTYVVLYMLDDCRNPQAPEYFDIASFFVRRYWPNREAKYRQLTPVQYAQWLVMLRQEKGRHLQPALMETLPLVDETDIGLLQLYQGKE